VIVAYAPGAVDAMMILALALALDPVFVGAHHLARVFMVSLALPILAHYFSASESKAAGSAWTLRPRGDGSAD
jgi:uncharacterized membrane protein AbrB (regulator of aidB expression)